jgi:hypothetical protein
MATNPDYAIGLTGSPLAMNEISGISTPPVTDLPANLRSETTTPAALRSDA